MLTPTGKELMPFQKEAVDKMLYFLDKYKGTYNACEMGLGKSIQSVAVINKLLPKSVLIICPSVMKYTWVEELKSWLTPAARIPFKKGIAVIESGKDDDKVSEASLVVTSYNLASSPDVLRAIQGKSWDILICDEAHYLKNRQAKRTKVILQKIQPTARYQIYLSGTPFTQSVVDGYPVFSTLAPDLYCDFYKFALEYAYMNVTKWGRTFYGVRNPEKLSKEIRERFYIRYKKKDVLKDLPPKTFSAVMLSDIDKLTGEEGKEIQSELQMIVDRIATGHGVKVSEGVARMRQTLGLKKVPFVVDYVKQLLDEKVPVVLFAWHKAVILELVKSLSKYKPSIITGATSSKDRMAAVTNFQTGKTDLFVGNLKAAGEGVTLTRSSTVVLAELDYSPAVIMQAVDRTHRIGQKDNVIVYYFMTRSMVDRSITNAVVAKMKAFKQVVD